MSTCMDITLSPENAQWLDQHMLEIKQQIIQRTSELDKEAASKAPMSLALARAVQEYAPGSVFPANENKGWWASIISQMSAVTFVSAILAITFAMIALLVSSVDGATAADAAAYIGIAKIFAGAIVGSTGVTVMSSMANSSN